jgi:hypothetical protein
MSGVSENVIRDYLKENLSVLESGLVLVDAERFVRGREGSGGYIDILARDKHGSHVFIELKRSESSAREALHEVSKYIQLSNLETHECRVFIVSTLWSELSSSLPLFQREMGYSIEGYVLDVDVNGVPLSSKKFDPSAVKVYRLEYHKEHLQVVFDDLVAARRAFDNLKDCINRFAVPVTVALFVNPNALEEVKARVYLAALRDWDESTISEAERLIQQTGIKDGRMPIDGPFNVYEDYLFAVARTLAREFLELDRGTPNKLASYNSFWGVDEVFFSKELGRRFPLHSSSDFIESASLKKAGGKDWLDIVFTSGHKASYKKHLESIDAFTRHQASWHKFILTTIKRTEREHENIDIDIQIFDPRNVVASLVGFHESQDDSHLPRYALTIKDSEGADLVSVIGSYIWNGLVLKGSPDDLFSSLGVKYISDLSFGRAEKDSIICDALGLSYASFQVYPEPIIYTNNGASNDFLSFYKAHRRWIERVTAGVASYSLG